MYNLEYTEEAKKDIQTLIKSGDLVALKKLEKLFLELIEHPKEGTGQPKILKHDFVGCWSRRITSKHRLIYKIEDEITTVLVLQTYGHYSDK